MILKELTNQFDLIICDEYHRLGGTETMIGIRDLIKVNPKRRIY